MAIRLRVRRTPTPAGATLLLGLLTGLAACSGSFDGNPLPGEGAANSPGAGTTNDPAPAGGTGGQGSGGSGTGKASGGTGGSKSGGGTGGSNEPAVSGVVPVTRAARLSHAQYRNSVRELFGIEDDPTAGFAPDALNGFAYDSSIDFAVDERLGPQYRAAAEELAARAVSDSAIFERIVVCDAAESSCAHDFIASFGQKAFRRPLSSAEQDRFATLFARGAELVGSGDDFADGVQVTLEAFLQSPQFLYRTELSGAVGADGLIALSPWETASRLAYFIWNSMPDGELFESAEQGRLASSTELDAAVARLLEDPRATEVGVSFHAQAWKFELFSRISPDEDTYPDAPADMVARVRSASERFVEEVIDSGGGLEELLTAPYAFADSALAPLYGADVAGGLERIDFEDGERRGFLMQVGFLASNAYAIKTDPIHRGLFVLRDLLCRSVPEPPAGASESELPETDEPIETTREEIELLTGQPDCRGCHTEINAPGFAFEGFDAVGSARTRENGVTVDTSGVFNLDGVDVTFSGPDELVDALAMSTEARNCYAAHWLTFAYGRDLVADDAPAQSEVGGADRSAKDIVLAVTKTRAFQKRAPNEVAP